MSGSGERPQPSGDGGDGEWIDQVLGRVPRNGSQPTGGRPPIVPETPAVAPITSRPVTDELAAIKWADSPDVRPASEPIVAEPVPVGRPETPALTAQAVGRSAWADELHSVGEAPAGWDKLSWNDMAEPAQGDSGPPVHEPASFLRVIREWGPVLISAVVIAVFVRLVLVQAYHIPSPSMSPTLVEGDRVIVNRLSYNFGDIERGQVIVFGRPPSQHTGANDLIKRVIGLPGETLEFRDGNVFVDGQLAQEPYLAQQNSTQPRSTIPGCADETPSRDRCTVPQGYVFVMGDNRTDSQDSRVFGPVATDSVVGRAFVRVWPLTNLGRL